MTTKVTSGTESARAKLRSWRIPAPPGVVPFAETQFMRIRVAFDITLSAAVPTPLILALSPHPDELHRLSAGALRLEPDVPVRWYKDGFDNQRGRLVMPPRDLRLRWEGMAADDGQPDDVNFQAEQHPVQDLPDEVLQFLQPSRYCESDLLTQEAWDRFGQSPRAGARCRRSATSSHGQPDLRLQGRLALPHRPLLPARGQGGVPRLRASRHRLRPRPEHPGALRLGLSWATSTGRTGAGRLLRLDRDVPGRSLVHLRRPLQRRRASAASSWCADATRATCR